MNQPIEPAILALRQRLLSTSRVYFGSQPQPGSRSGWAGRGNGTVVAEAHADISLTLTESGRFRLEGAAESIAFHNVFRWRFYQDRISLSHERRGPEAAVWLFDLVAADHEQSCDLISREAHLCGRDRYRARLTFMDQGFDLEWTIQGPRKDEHLHYRYR
ncbi:DUF6314 family protein [Halomonas sp. GXIMD04776]|uniref:DUF6314 family protein n=1 Tax=Halomonas sp. GXIMD04776 TaxID=3415605 RepID=UPI003C9DBD38